MASPRHTDAKRHVLSKRARVGLRILGSALVAAVIMLAVAFFWAPKPGIRVSPEETAAAKAATEYQQGLSALNSGDTTKAITLLTQSAADGSPVAGSALAQARARTAASSSSSDTSSGSTTTSTASVAATAGIYAHVISTLSSVVPTSFAGYRAGGANDTGDYYSVPLTPSGTGAAAGVRIASVTINDMGSSARAAAFVSGIKKAYKKDVRKATAGRMSGMFGTDGVHTASFRFARGRYTVEVLVVSTSTAPLGLEKEALRLAALLPASR
jgi:hypothetical protein